MTGRRWNSGINVRGPEARPVFSPAACKTFDRAPLSMKRRCGEKTNAGSGGENAMESSGGYSVGLACASEKDMDKVFALSQASG